LTVKSRDFIFEIMTRLVRSPEKASQRAKAQPRRTGALWALQDAKANLSEVVRRARESGPQHVTIHGEKAAVVVSTEEFMRLSVRAKYPTLRALFAPLRGIEIKRRSTFAPVRRPIEL
jgi:prevent-host-death family protein